MLVSNTKLTSYNTRFITEVNASANPKNGILKSLYNLVDLSYMLTSIILTQVEKSNKTKKYSLEWSIGRNVIDEIYMEILNKATFKKLCRVALCETTNLNLVLDELFRSTPRIITMKNHFQSLCEIYKECDTKIIFI